MTRSHLAALVVAAFVVPAAGHAQSVRDTRLGISQPTHAMAPGWDHSFAADSVPANHWVDGMAIGAGIGLVIGYGLYRLAAYEDEGQGVSSALILLPMVLFGLIGGMIGSASTRK